MIHALELENFKAFGKRAKIPFAPITLIFGENSAGKSSILQALNLLKQTVESREAGAVLLPRAENGIVDLGSFQEMIFDHDLERTLSIRVETTMNDREKAILASSYRKNKIGIEFRFERPSLKEEVLLDEINIYDGKSAKRIAKFRPSGSIGEDSEFVIGRGFFRHLSGLPPSKLTTMECVWLTEASAYWKPEFDWCQENRESILDTLKERFAELQHNADEEGKNKPREELRPLADDIKFFSSNFDLKAYISKRHKEEMSTGLGLLGFLPYNIMYRERNRWIIESRFLLHRQSDDIETFDVAELAIAAGEALERTLDYLFPMGPFRSPPERWYIFRGTSPQDVGYRGDLLPDLLFRRPELVKDTNEWLQRLDIGYELAVKAVGDSSGDLFEVRLIDTRREDRVNVALPDVGFGISQLLPFVVQSLVAERQIISIEQPEVHVHPKLQADLGDLLAEAIKEPRQNQFIIETHSEHLILRLQRLVYEQKIKPEDISVIYVSRGPDGAESQRLHIDEEGDFIDEWPNGFFPERLRELR